MAALMELWLEGWLDEVNFDYEPPKFLGQFAGETLEEACALYENDSGKEVDYERYGHPSIDGLKIFDNEHEASKAFELNVEEEDEW